MKISDLGAVWLADRAAELQTAARKTEEAYTEPTVAEMCGRVAGAYRRAAAVLEEEAHAMTKGAGDGERTEGR